MKFTKIELVLLLRQNTQQQPKAKYSNLVILQMLDKMPSDFVADVETTRGGFLINRGSLVECIVKAVVYGFSDSFKSSCYESDLNTSGLDAQHLRLVNDVESTNIEVKFSTSFAPATRKRNKARKTIIVSESGIYMINSRDIIYTPAGKININNQHRSDLTKLEALEEALGF